MFSRVLLCFIAAFPGSIDIRHFVKITLSCDHTSAVSVLMSFISHSCLCLAQEEDRSKHRKKRNRFIDDIAAVDEDEEEEEDDVCFRLLSLHCASVASALVHVCSEQTKPPLWASC